MAAPQIRRLELTRFRGIESLVWWPSPGVNLILGGGDVGKSTLLEAIALLLYPTNGFVLSDTDYFKRRVENELLIEAVMSLPGGSGIHDQAWTAWPWEWDGKQAVLPNQEVDGPVRDAVYRVRVRGTSESDLAYEVMQPDCTVVSFPTALRRRIGLVRLTADDRSDRDLRLIQGGALDRLLDDRALRARLSRHLAQDGLQDQLVDNARARLTALDVDLTNRHLPHGLGLGFVGGPGVSINSLVGLTSDKDGVALPMTSWGAGTRRLAALAIAENLQDGAPIILIDEIERGLEPYRQTALMRKLSERPSQTMVTTHSGFAIAAATGATLWFMDAAGSIGELPAEKVGALQKSDPAALLSRLTVIAEGVTEVGFLEVLLERQVAPDWGALGLYIADGGGNDRVLQLLEGLLSGGVRFAAMADREAGDPAPERWARVQRALGDRLLRWDEGSLESNVLPLFGVQRLQALITDPDNRRTGQRRRSLIDRLGLAPDADLEQISVAAGDGLMQVVVDAALGKVPSNIVDDERRKMFKGHSSQWFKSHAGGRELANKVFELDLWPGLEPRFTSFLAALRQAVHD
ncbi:MAG: AAA family ATPase [Silanimonas sp.]|jgi:putative ATP-dependent endonuclease of OLD family|nr:AAA family ATPase [Silanimonas sp.]